MTRKLYQIILFIQLLIYGSLSVLDEAKLRECLNAYYAQYIQNSADVLFTPTQYVIGLPECVIKMKPDDTGTDICNLKAPQELGGVDFSVLSGFFECFNEWNDGSDIQQPGATAILWSGDEGEAGANQEITKHNNGFPEPKPGSKFTDKRVKACDINLAILNRMNMEKITREMKKEQAVPSLSDEQRQMFFDLTFLWFIWNSDPEVHDYTIQQFSSIKAYEHGRVQGRNKLLEAGVTEALTINNIFWKVELPSIARMFYFKQQQSHQIKPKLELNLRLYERGNAVPEYPPEKKAKQRLGIMGRKRSKNKKKSQQPVPRQENIMWHKYDLFDDNGLDKVHVIYYDHSGGVNYPLYMNAKDVTTCTLQDVIDKYNAVQGNQKLRINLPLYTNMNALLQFLDWASKLPINGGVAGKFHSTSLNFTQLQPCCRPKSTKR